MKNEGLLTGSDIEVIEDISTEEKCKYIFKKLTWSGLIYFQKFIVLLSEDHLHVTIVEKILQGIVISL